MSETETIGDLIGDRQLQRFVGREDFLKVVRHRFTPEVARDDAEWSILNIYGQAGVGKSTLLSRIEEEARETAIPAAGVDVDHQESVSVAITTIAEELAEFDEETLKEFDRMRDDIREIENKIHRRMEDTVDGEEDEMSTLGSATAQTVGGLVGLGLSGAIGSAIGAGAGELLAEKLQPSKLRRILQSAELTPEEIRLYSNAVALLTAHLVDVINELAARNGHVVLTFDTYEKVNPSLDEWVREEFLRELNRDVVLVFAGRNRLMDREGWKVFEPAIKQRELTNFSEEETIAFWRERGIHDQEKAATLHRITNGHPLLNDAIADIINSQADQLDIDTLLRNEKSMRSLNRLLKRFMNEAPADTREVLRTCAVARAFEMEMLKTVSELDDEQDFDQITKLSFVFQNVEGRYQVHDLAREALIEDFRAKSPQKFHERHSEIAGYLRSLRESGVGYERLVADEIYHRLSANEEEGLEFAQVLFRMFRQQGSPIRKDTLLSELATYDFDTVEGRLWKQFAQANISFVQGEWERAHESLPQAEEIPVQDPELESCVQELQTKLLIGQGEYSEAFGLQQHQVEKLLDEITDMEAPPAEREVADEHIHTVAENYSRIIELCAILSQFKDGEKYIKEAKQLVSGDPMAEAKILLGEAALHRLQGKTTAGINAAERAAEISRELGDERQVIHGEIQLARLETHDGEWAQAEERLDKHLPEEDSNSKSETVSEEPISYYDLGNIYLFKGNIYRRRRDWQTALTLYEQAHEIHERMDSLREIGPMYGSIGLVYTHRGDFDLAAQYLNDSLRIKQNQDYERGVGITRKYLGDYHLSRGKLALAREEYEQAAEIGDRLSVIYLAQWARVGLGWVAVQQQDTDWVEKIFNDSVFDAYEYGDISGKKYVILGIADHLTTAESGLDTVRRGFHRCLEYNPYIAYATLEDIEIWLLDADHPSSPNSEHRRELRNLLAMAVDDVEIRELERRERNGENVPDSCPTLQERVEDV